MCFLDVSQWLAWFVTPSASLLTRFLVVHMHLTKGRDWLRPACPYQFNLHLQSYRMDYRRCQPPRAPTRRRSALRERGEDNRPSRCSPALTARTERGAKRAPWLPSSGHVRNWTVTQNNTGALSRSFHVKCHRNGRGATSTEPGQKFNFEI